VESPTRGVAIVDVTIGSQLTPAPLHWRAGDWTKPPLDVALSPDGRIDSIQVVFQDETVVTSGSEQDEPQGERGVPRFETSDWPTDRYLDVPVSVNAARLSSGGLMVSIDHAKPVRSLNLGEALRLALDSSDHLTRIIIGPLNDDQWRLIDAAAAD
jgi:hypothetical protein